MNIDCAMVITKLKGFEPKHKLAGANQQQFLVL